jgi:antitoxin PrlF
MIRSRMSSKAQTTIPRSVRVALGLREGDRVVLTRVRQTETPEATFATFAEWSSDADTAAYAGL